MYTAHFGLKDNPFSITPDPRYLFLSPRHQEALAHLLYGISENGGFVQLTGEVGTGKTTLIRTLLEQKIEDVDVALCLNPRLTVEELVATICDELDAHYPTGGNTLKPLVDALNRHLLETHARGRRTVLIIDEAQNLSFEVLEQIRLLTNLETHRHKLLRIILVGQPELQDLLARRDLRQLAQRITARYHLTPLSRAETAAYITHRLAVARGRTDLFTKPAIRSIYRRTQGIPRLINILCDRALMGAYAQGRAKVGAGTVRHAAREAVQLPPARPAGGLRHWAALGAAPVSVLVAAAALNGLQPGSLPPPVAPSASARVDSAETPDHGSVKSEGSDVLPALALGRPAEPTESGADTTQSIGVPEIAALVEPTVSAKISVPRDASNSPGTSDPSSISNPPETTASFPSALPPASNPASRPPATPSPTADSPAAPDSAIELERQVFDIDTPDDSMAKLLRLWGKLNIATSEVASCEQVSSDGLRCLYGQGDWDTLRRYNRPVILTLAGREGRKRGVLLRALTADVATLDIGQSAVRATLEDLTRIWTGDFLMIWRMETSYPLIGPKSWGRNVQWLRQRLALAQGKTLAPEEPLSMEFDPALREQIKQFQSAHGLVPDGVVGEFTMPLLNNLAPAPGTPFLESPPVARTQ